MSIVLVIIGLIIGGILKGQEVIAQARQKALINQVNAVRSAAGTYFDRYRALPGDDPSATTQLNADVAAGDGDGIVGTNNTNVAGILAQDSSTGEPYEFFNGLMASNLLNGGQVLPAASAAAFGTSALPASPITGAGLTVAYGTIAGDTAAYDATNHWLNIHKGIAANTPAVSPRTLLNIDVQTDDGQAQRGGVRSDGSTGCGAANTYALSDDALCVPMFQVTQ
jgi:hypothetical protein